MPIQGPIDRDAVERKIKARHQLPPGVFEARQRELAAAGNPGDPCGRCGCSRRHHRPKPTFSYSKSGGSSGKSVELPVLAPTSCDCPWCLCSCVEFVEPFWGQPHWACAYDKGEVSV